MHILGGKKMSIFKQLEEELEKTIDNLRIEFELLEADNRGKDYRKFLKKLQNIQTRMADL